VKRRETEHFINDGYGWMCKRCRPAEMSAAASGGRARFFTEGEAEEREIDLSAAALARWRDPSHQSLFCPRCGIEERVM